jgi:hypothetical protein
MKQFFGFLLLGALHRQRGDHSNIYFSRAAFWVALSTSLYVTSLAHWIFQKQFITFSKMKGESLFSYKDFDGSYLMAGLLTLGLMITFFFVYWPEIVVQFKESKKKGSRYGIFLLYFLPSFLAFVWTRGFVFGF